MASEEQELTPEEIKNVKQWYAKKKQDLGLGKAPILSYLGFEGLALRWKRKYGALDIGDFYAYVDLALTYEENVTKERLAGFVKAEEEYKTEEELTPIEEPTPIETLEEEVLTMQDKILELEHNIKQKIGVVEEKGMSAEDMQPYLKELQKVRDRQDFQKIDLEKLNRKLDEVIMAGKPIKEEKPPPMRIVGEPEKLFFPEVEREIKLFVPGERKRRSIYCKRCRAAYTPYTAREKKIMDNAFRDIEFQTQKTFDQQVFTEAYKTCPKCLNYLYYIVFPKR